MLGVDGVVVCLEIGLIRIMVALLVLMVVDCYAWESNHLIGNYRHGSLT